MRGAYFGDVLAMYVYYTNAIYIHILFTFVYVLCYVMLSHGRQVKQMRAESEKSDVDESSSLLKVCEGRKETSQTRPYIYICSRSHVEGAHLQTPARETDRQTARARERERERERERGRRLTWMRALLSSEWGRVVLAQSGGGL